MYIEVNGQQYQNAQRIVTCAFVDFYAEGLENVDKAYGIVNSYEDDGTLLATDNTADYSGQERVDNRLRLYDSVEALVEPVVYDETAYSPADDPTAWEEKQ